MTMYNENVTRALAERLDELKKSLRLLEQCAEHCETWAEKSRQGGWSTHQVEPQKKLAIYLREYVASARVRAGIETRKLEGA